MRIGNDKTILLTGRRGVGKTTVCQAVAELARRRGYRPGGVITPALHACPEPVLSPSTLPRINSEGQSRRACPERSRRACPADWELGIGNWELTKVGFEAMDVDSGERWPLAHTDQKMGGPRVGPYSFDPIALDRTLRVLRKAISAECDLLIIDEIGPLELEQGEGFAPILDLLPVEGPTHTLIVIRPALLDPLRLHLRGTEFTVFTVNEENRNKLPLRIVEALWGDRHCCAVR